MQNGTLLDLAENLYPPFNDLLWQMERRGVYVSLPELRRIESDATAARLQAEAALNKYAGKELNWNANTSDVAWFCYDHLSLPDLPEDARAPKYWGKERIVAHDAIEYWYRHHPDRRPELDQIRTYRRACRARNYVSDLESRAQPMGDGLGVVHPTYGSYSDSSAGRDKTGTATGRLSISNPPLQQIPRDKKKDPYRVRRAFVSPPGTRLVVVDMEQLEVRIQAHIHIALFNDPTLRDFCLGGDFHGATAYDVFSEIWPTLTDWTTVDPAKLKQHPDPAVQLTRELVKAVFYGLAYGANDKSTGARLWTLEGNPIGTDVAKAIREGIFKRIPAIPRYQEWVLDQVVNKGGMWDIFGVWRPLEKSKRGYRQGLNQPLQGSGARLVMLWMLLIQGLRPTLQVHDEVHCVVPEDLADDAVKDIEQAAKAVGDSMGLKCVLQGKGAHGSSWDDAK